MQRLYSTFASGRPGTGLLLLRLAVSLVAFLEAGGLLGAQQTAPGLVWMGCGGLLLLGLETPLAGAATLLSAVGRGLGSPPPMGGGLPDGWLFPGFVAAVARMRQSAAR